MPPRATTLDDIVLMDGAATPQGRRKPSSEWRFHHDIYASRPDAEAVVHAHPPFCVALAVLHRGIPSFHYMVAMAGGNDIRCAPYATYGTQELSDHALTALTGRRACLLGNHGMIALGADLDRALALAVEVEGLAEGYWRALQIGAPVLLDDAEMARVVEKFATYGANAQNQVPSR
jgi:L-fuculose-phosphate aldolase